MDVPVFLTHFDAAGVKEYTALDLYDTISTYYLPNVWSTPLNVSREQDSEHSTIRLDVCSTYCLLTVYSNDSGPTTVVGDCDVEMPVSTTSHQKSFIVTDLHQFTTSTGRWQVEWDELGDISSSMRPPPLPEHLRDTIDEQDMEHLGLIMSQGQGRIVNQEEMDDLSEEEHAPIPVAEIRLSPRSVSSEDEVRNGVLQDRSDDQPSSQPHTSPEASADEQHGEMRVTKNQDLHPVQLQAKTEFKDTNQVTIETDTHDSADTTSIGAHSHGSASPANSIPPVIDTTTQSKEPYLGTRHNLSEEIQIIEEDDGDRQDTNVLADSTTPRNNLPVDAVQNKTTMTDDEETASESEDESQRMKDVRIPKRRLLEIEAEQSPSRGKRQKLSKDVEQSINSKQDDPIAEPIKPIKSPAAVRLTVVRENSPSKQEEKAVTKKTPRVRVQAKPKSTTKSLSGSTPVLSTPARKSTRNRSETPVSSSKLDTAEYGRPRVVFGSTSTIPKNKKMMSTIERLGGTVVTDIDEADILCIGTGQLKKTSKFVIAIAKGKDIVTDEWVKQANSEQRFPDLEAYLPKDRKHEKEWGFKLSEALDRGRKGLKLLEDVQIYMTTQLCKDLGNLTKELKHVASSLGATRVHNGLPKKGAKGRILVVRSTKNVDPEGWKVHQLGHKLYGQDVLTMTALRGRFDMDSDEFVIKVPIKEEPASS